MGRGDLARGARDALAPSCGVCYLRSAANILQRRTHTGKILPAEDVEYRPQRGLGTLTLVKAWFAVVVAAIVLSLGLQHPAAPYLAAFPAAAAIAWFAAYAGKRRLRVRLAPTGIESRRLRTRVIPWTQIRDVKVVTRFTVAHLAVRGSRSRYTSGSGGGARKLSSVRVQLANGRRRELAMPVAWENAPDPEFTDKANVIKDRWRTAIGQTSAV